MKVNRVVNQCVNKRSAPLQLPEALTGEIEYSIPRKHKSYTEWGGDCIVRFRVLLARETGVEDRKLNVFPNLKLTRFPL